MSTPYQITWRNFREKIPVYAYNGTTHKFVAMRTTDKLGVEYDEETGEVQFSVMGTVRMSILNGIITVVGEYTQFLNTFSPRLDFERVGLRGNELLGSIHSDGKVFLRDLREAELPAFTDGVLLDSKSCILPGGIWYADGFVES